MTQGLIGIGTVLTVIGALVWADTLSGGHPEINGFAVGVAVLGMFMIAMAFGLEALAEHMAPEENGSE